MEAQEIKEETKGDSKYVGKSKRIFTVYNNKSLHLNIYVELWWHFSQVGGGVNGIKVFL